MTKDIIIAPSVLACDFSKLGDEVEAVVEAGLAGLAKNKAIVVPGFLNKAMVQSNRLSPRSVSREIAKLLQQ